MSISRKKKALVQKALDHEYYRCMDAYISFNYYLSNPSGKDIKRNRILCYNSYSDFLAHLYEFYIKMIERSSIFQETGIYENYESFKCKGSLKKTDIIIKEEVEKLLRNRKNRIENGYKDNLGFDIVFYDQKVPKEIGQHLSYMRHRRNHVDSKRISDDKMSLATFYRKYHNFMVILFEELRWIWQVDEESFYWVDIEEFAKEIKN
ncbi:hypothetical protein [Marinifilum fragile]|uniref:hypothetical protein n=1 Tax=Marinifilum fragile TaxID=570161 RepID=UPI0006D02173|nr:hypothetical protein [Marinifilum fragile]